MERYGLVAYGCCENLTPKIKVLRQIKNLRIIAVPPVADVAKCAKQIGADYVFSWRPSPAEMVCGDFDPARIKRTLAAGLEAARGCHVYIHLKDIESVEGEPERIRRWVELAREVAVRF